MLFLALLFLPSHNSMRRRSIFVLLSIAKRREKSNDLRDRGKIFLVFPAQLFSVGSKNRMIHIFCEKRNCLSHESQLIFFSRSNKRRNQRKAFFAFSLFCILRSAFPSFLRGFRFSHALSLLTIHFSHGLSSFLSSHRLPRPFLLRPRPLIFTLLFASRLRL